MRPAWKTGDRVRDVMECATVRRIRATCLRFALAVECRERETQANHTVAAARPTSRRRAGALSLRSQVKLGSSRPKCPWRAVSR
jgi:hypothetical protein